MFPYKYLWAKAPAVRRFLVQTGRPRQDAPKRIPTSAAFHFLPILLQLLLNPTSSCTAPPFSATTHRHRWSLPMFTSQGLEVAVPKPKVKTPRLYCAVVLKEWGWEDLWYGSWRTISLGDALEKLDQGWLFHVCELVVGKMGWAAIRLPPRGLTHWWLKLLQPLLKIRTPLQIRTKSRGRGREATPVKEGKWWEEGRMLLSDLITFFASVLQCVLVRCATQWP